jgi:2-hydroxychromene-2-carboxylate isomerase
MAAPVEFYFDFSSPYGYLAAQQIDDVAARHGRTVAWRPFLLGVAFKQSGNRPLVDQPLKGAYSTHDMRRCARRLGVPFQLPATFPFMSVAACRAFYAVSDRDPAAAKDLARALYDAAFAQGRDISDAGAVLDIAQERGLDRAPRCRSPISSSQGAPQDRSRSSARARRLRVAVLHRRRRAILGA